jgi:hypothetical protein
LRIPPARRQAKARFMKLHMLLRLPVLLLLAVGLLVRTSTSGAGEQNASCRANRADVMTLSDSEAHIIDSSPVLGVHVSTLAALPQPDQLGVDPRFDPYETTIWVTGGKLLKAQLDADGAIDAVIQDPETTDSITIVFPDPSGCAQNADSKYQEHMNQARYAFIEAAGMPDREGTPYTGGLLTVTGVGFLQKLATTSLTGAGIELAPVVAIEFVEAPSRSQAAAATNRAASAQPETSAPLPEPPPKIR